MITAQGWTVDAVSTASILRGMELDGEKFTTSEITRDLSLPPTLSEVCPTVAEWAVPEMLVRAAYIKRLSALSPSEVSSLKAAEGSNFEVRRLALSGDLEQAINIQTQSLKELRVLTGDRSLFVARFLETIAETRRLMGQYASCESAMDEAKAIFGELLTERHPYYLTANIETARCRVEAKNFEGAGLALMSALPLLTELLQTLQLPMTDQDWSTLKDFWKGQHLDPKNSATVGAGIQMIDSLRLIVEMARLGSKSELLAHLGNGRFEPSTLLSRFRKLHEEFLKQFGSASLAQDQLQDQLKDLFRDHFKEGAPDDLAEDIAVALGSIIRDADDEYLDLAENLGVNATAAAHFQDGESLYRDVLATEEADFGNQTARHARILRELALCVAAQGRASEASKLLLESSDALWTQIALILPYLTQEEKLRFLKLRDAELPAVSFERSDALIGYQRVLLDKQLNLEANRQERGAILSFLATAPPEYRQAWRDFLDASRRLASLALVGADPSLKEEIASLRAVRERSENRLRDETGTRVLHAAGLTKVKAEDVASAIPAGQALVEYTMHRQISSADGKLGDPRYAAFIVIGGNGQVIGVDLGDAAPIDKAVRQFRNRASDAGTPEREVATFSSALRGLIWTPLEQYLGKAKRVYVAPTGMLVQVPLDALAKSATDEIRYLVEDKEIVYIPTGRELIRIAREKGPNIPKRAVVVSDPAFNAEPIAILRAIGEQDLPIRTSVPSGSACQTLRTPAVTGEKRQDWPELCGEDPASASARQLLSQLGWSVVSLTREKASEEALAEFVPGAGILQITTHGEYREKAAHKDEKPGDQEADNPLLRSRLILAGANKWTHANSVYYRAGTELLTAAEASARGFGPDAMSAIRLEVNDGVLTATEVTGLDLRGTELVNLTACQTALGETSDGVGGLGQAFLVAGARSITMSLWNVPKAETLTQIADFYHLWLDGTGVSRYSAFRQSQLEALKAARARATASPYYWAGTVFVGDPGDAEPEPAGAPTAIPATESLPLAAKEKGQK